MVTRNSSSLQRTFTKTLSSLIAYLLLPLLFIQGIVSKKWCLSLTERLGKGGWRKFNQKASSPYIWVHAASLGEIAGVKPVIQEIQERYPDSLLHVTTTSLTGKKEVQEKRLCDHPLLLPFDHPLILSQIFNQRPPKLFLLFETELWPNLLFTLQKRAIPIILINGRISDRTFPHYRLCRYLVEPMLQTINTFLLQTVLDAERFIELGADSKKVKVVGSTKFDFENLLLNPSERQQLQLSLGLIADAPCFVAGSIRPTEDKTIIASYLQARQEVPNLQMIFAPRHPERFKETAKLLTEVGIDFHYRSNGAAALKKPVVLLDSVGELSKMYSLASFAFVGATLVDIGGHNPLEPASCGVPVIVGPHTQNVREIVSRLKQEQGLIEVKDEKELTQTIIKLSIDHDYRKVVGNNALCVWKANRGAIESVMKVVEKHLW